MDTLIRPILGAEVCDEKGTAGRTKPPRVRGEADLQEDLLQDARLALCVQFTKGLRNPTHARVVAASAMLHGRRTEMRRRHESLDLLIEREAHAAAKDDREAAA